MSEDYKCPQCGNTKEFYELRTFPLGEGVKLAVEVEDDGGILEKDIAGWGNYSIEEIECAECGHRIKVNISTSNFAPGTNWKDQK